LGEQSALSIKLDEQEIDGTIRSAIIEESVLVVHLPLLLAAGHDRRVKRTGMFRIMRSAPQSDWHRYCRPTLKHEVD